MSQITLGSNTSTHLPSGHWAPSPVTVYHPDRLAKFGLWGLGFFFPVPTFYPKTTTQDRARGERTVQVEPQALTASNHPPLRASRELGSLYPLVILFSLQVSCDLYLQPPNLDTEHLVPLYLRP